MTTQRTVLIVNDNPADRQVLYNILNERYKILQVSNGKEGIDILHQSYGSIDAVLLAITIPIIDGYTFLSEMQKSEQLSQTPVIVTEGNSIENAEAKALSLGAVEFISKPYSAIVVLNRVKNALSRGRAAELEKQNELLTQMHLIEQRAKTDGLTNLMNRTEFEAQVSNFFSGSGANESMFFILDIDNFKMVNDQLGHAKGDEAIQKVANILKSCFRQEDLVARFGGDEFAAFVKTKVDDKSIKHRLDSLCEKLSFAMDNLRITCSVGLCSSPEYGNDYQTLYQNADMALLTAKRLGKNQYQIFGGNIDLPSHVLYRNMDWLLDEASDGIFVCDAKNYDLLYLNDVACGLAGKSKKECLGKKCYSALWNRESPCSHCINIGKLSNQYGEYEINPDNTERCFIVKGKLIDWGGLPARIQYIQDNTEKAMREKELREISIDRKRILDSMPGGIFRYYAKNDSIDFVSENMLKMLGYTREQFEKKFQNKFALLVWHEDIERVQKEIDEQIACADVDECEYRIEKADGTLCWVHDVGHLVREDDGTTYFYVTIVDITKNRQLQMDLLAEQKKLEIALAYSGLQYWEYDVVTDICTKGINGKNTEIQDVTPNFTEFLLRSGYIPENYLNTAKEKLRLIHDGVRFLSFDMPIVLPDGKQTLYHIHCESLQDEMGKPVKVIGTAQNLEEDRSDNNTDVG